MFGVTLWEMYAREAPYKHLNGTQASLHIVSKGNGLAIKTVWPKTVRDVISNCLQTNPQNRPTMSEVHAELIRYLNSFDPKQSVIIPQKPIDAGALVGGGMMALMGPSADVRASGPDL